MFRLTIVLAVCSNAATGQTICLGLPTEKEQNECARDLMAPPELTDEARGSEFFDDARAYCDKGDDLLDGMDACLARRIETLEYWASTIPPIAQGEIPPHWTITRQIDPFDDSETITASIESEEGLACAYGQKATLGLICRGGETTEYVVNHGCYAPGSWVTVESRVDRESPNESWVHSGVSGHMFGMTNLMGPATGIVNLIGAERLALRFQPYQSNPQTLIFDVRGAELALRPIREACGW